eukprot:COSAG02_NODE_39_length_48074_cov_106.508890_13_plen_56_part_00
MLAYHRAHRLCQRNGMHCCTLLRHDAVYFSTITLVAAEQNYRQQISMRAVNKQLW